MNKTDYSLEDESVQEFRGGTLRINTDTITFNVNRDSSSILNASEVSETESVAKLDLSDNTANQLPVDKQKSDISQINVIDNTSIPAISSGADVVSPIASLPITPVKATDTLWNSKKQSKAVSVVTTMARPFPLEPPKHFFSHRQGLLASAIQESIKLILVPADDANVIGSWLLTEISLWDHERERLVILTDKTVTTVKYDFIALRLLTHKRVFLNKIDTVVYGKLVYPSASVVPRLGGIAEGVSDLIGGLSIFSSSCASRQSASSDKNAPSSRSTLIDWDNFAPRDRNTNGVRLLWNGGKPLPFTTMWNPFSHDVPMNTYTSHPLFWNTTETINETNKELYDVEIFFKKVTEVLKLKIPTSNGSYANTNLSKSTPNLNEAAQIQSEEVGSTQIVGSSQTVEENQGNSIKCNIELQPIVLQSYIGLGAMVHNKNGLGFFKVRGKFSF